MTESITDIMAAYSVIFKGLHYLGPGDAETTHGVIKRIKEFLPAAPRIADMGCGVGASTLALASAIPDALILAVDIHEPFIKQLQATASAQDLNKRIKAKVADMSNPPTLNSTEGAFDLIWAESSIYTLGRKQALKIWHPLLQTEGLMVFSDIVWKNETADCSEIGKNFWTNEYPDIATIEQVLNELEETGYHVLPPAICNHVVWSNYYEPLRHRLDQLATRTNHSPALVEVMNEMIQEIKIYDETDDVNLVFFIGKKG